jgi:cation:H+ antiporter
MVLLVLAAVLGLVLLIWSADKFIDGAAATASHLGMPPLLIGMVIIGFGTSAPEMMVSAFAAVQGNPGVALGNAYGSNIANIALVLGCAALVSPIGFGSELLRRKLPLLTAVTALAAAQLWDGELTRVEAWLLIVLFVVLLGRTIVQGMGRHPSRFGSEVEEVIAEHPLSRRQALLYLVAGLILLIVSSRVLVWSAVEVAQALGIDDLIIGLTVVAIGTSLPELASGIAAARKGEHDIVLGNVIGSNLFNTLAVVGIAAGIEPLSVGPEVLARDVLLMSALTLSLFVVGYGFGRPGRVNRVEGGLLLVVYLGYLAFLVATVIAGH